jgi:CHU_C Type IX secretion signal domain
MTSCDPSQMILKPYSDPLGFNYEWQDGSTNDSFFVSDFGKYWVSIKNKCGQVSDTITLTKYNLKIGFVPNVITPNGDDKNEFFQIDPIYSGLVSLKVLNRWGAEVFFSQSYKNDWNGAGLSAGVYYVVLEGSCIERFKGPLTIIR